MNPNNKGQSLVQVLVGIGLTAIMAAVFASLITSQQKETRALKEALGAMDLQKVVIAALADGSVCQYILNNPTRLTFDSTALTPTTPQTMTPSLPLYTIVQGGIPGPVAAQVGQEASGFSNTLFISNIKLEILSGSGDNYIGQWKVEFDSARTIRPIRPLAVGTIIQTDPGTPTAKTIASCQGAGGGSSNFAVESGTLNHGQVIPLPVGFTDAQCRWIVSMDSGGAAYDYRTHERCYTTGRTVQCWTGNSAWGGQIRYGTATYLIVCQR